MRFFEVVVAIVATKTKQKNIDKQRWATWRGCVIKQLNMNSLASGQHDIKHRQGSWTLQLRPFKWSFVVHETILRKFYIIPINY
jgi:hypothetical protein